MSDAQTVKVGGDEISKEEYQKLRQAGKIVFHPKVDEDGNMQTTDGRRYKRGKSGGFERQGGLGRMSKKQRRKARQEALADG